MKQLEILVEEPSMKNALIAILPRVLPQDYVLQQNCFIPTHEGKQHLQKSLPGKIKGYKKFPHPVRVLVIQDQDSNDCKAWKENIQALIRGTGVTVDHLIRIACRELECWYAGDLDAVEAVYPRFKASHHKEKTKFGRPDRMQCAEEFRRLIPGFTKYEASKHIPPKMQIENNRSESFRQFIRGVKNWLNTP